MSLCPTGHWTLDTGRVISGYERKTTETSPQLKPCRNPQSTECVVFLIENTACMHELAGKTKQGSMMPTHTWHGYTRTCRHAHLCMHACTHMVTSMTYTQAHPFVLAPTYTYNCLKHSQKNHVSNLMLYMYLCTTQLTNAHTHTHYTHFLAICAKISYKLLIKLEPVHSESSQVPNGWVAPVGGRKLQMLLAGSQCPPVTSQATLDGRRWVQQLQP